MKQKPSACTVLLLHYMFTFMFALCADHKLPVSGQKRKQQRRRLGRKRKHQQRRTGRKRKQQQRRLRRKRQ